MPLVLPDCRTEKGSIVLQLEGHRSHKQVTLGSPSGAAADFGMHVASKGFLPSPSLSRRAHPHPLSAALYVTFKMITVKAFG